MRTTKKWRDFTTEKWFFSLLIAVLVLKKYDALLVWHFLEKEAAVGNENTFPIVFGTTLFCCLNFFYIILIIIENFKTMLKCFHNYFGLIMFTKLLC